MNDRHAITAAPPDAVSIVTLREGHVRAAADALAASFADDPAYAHLIRDPQRRQRVLRAFLAIPVRDAVPFGTADVAVLDGDVVGAAVWLPPGAYPWSLARKLRAMPGFASVLVASPRSLRGLMQLGANVERAFPHHPVWYLEVVGVLPQAQRRGIGSRLLKPGIARADAARNPCYLETPRPENLPFYGRLGFTVEREGVQLLGHGPTHWTMIRHPKGA